MPCINPGFDTGGVANILCLAVCKRNVPGVQGSGDLASMHPAR